LSVTALPNGLLEIIVIFWVLLPNRDKRLRIDGDHLEFFAGVLASLIPDGFIDVLIVFRLYFAYHLSLLE
jgi:hypothetical protein